MPFERWKRIVLAAIRLAALYAVGVALLFLPIALTTGHHRVLLDRLQMVGMSAGFVFLVAFLLLALTRRLGFLVLWGLLLAMWLSLLSEGSMSDTPGWFILWTIAALPLYIIGMFTSRSPTSRVGLNAAVSGAILWGVLLAGAIWYVSIYDSAFEDPTWIDAAARFAWVPAPFVLASLAITGIWVGTREHSS